MRRVIDDTHYEEVATKINNLIGIIPVRNMTEYHYGSNRVQVHLIKQYLFKHMPEIKFGNVTHANGIGNNNSIECIWKSDTEEQICALLHLTDDMFGGVYAWVSDIDNVRKTTTYHITERGIRKG